MPGAKNATDPIYIIDSWEKLLKSIRESLNGAVMQRELNLS